MPICRIAPPSMRRWRSAAAISSREPASSDPPGAPSPLENDTATRSNGAASSATRWPVAAAAFHSRAPSRKVAMPRSPRRGADALDLGLREDDAAGAVVRVLDLDQRRRRIDAVQSRGFTAATNSSALNKPPRADLVQLHAGVGRRAAGLVPDGVALAADDHVVAGPRQHAQRDLVGHRAAWAARARPPCRAARPRAPAGDWSLGSSPYWSSPTGAAAIAARIAAVGRVTVSERRSMVTGLLALAGWTRGACPIRESGIRAGARQLLGCLRFISRHNIHCSDNAP